MARLLFTMPRMLVALTALAIGALGTGCTSEVVGGGGGGEGGGGGGTTGTGGAVAVTMNACMTEGQSQSCAPDPSSPNEGNQTCMKNGDGKLVWSQCGYSAASTPLVLSFDGAPVTFAASTRAFAINKTMSVATDWPTARTPWLALDRNSNGAIDDGGELFGSATQLKNGERASNGFIALRELDTDGDGQLTPADAGWSQLRLWNDSDSDRVSSGAELTGLGARRLVSIDLGYAIEKRCDDRGNCEVERAGFRYVDEAGVERSGVVIDVHLAHK